MLTIFHLCFCVRSFRGINFIFAVETFNLIVLEIMILCHSDLTVAGDMERSMIRSHFCMSVCHILLFDKLIMVEKANKF